MGGVMELCREHQARSGTMNIFDERCSKNRVNQERIIRYCWREPHKESIGPHTQIKFMVNLSHRRFSVVGKNCCKLLKKC